MPITEMGGILKRYIKEQSPDWCSKEQIQQINDYLMGKGERPIDRMYGHRWWHFQRYIKERENICKRCEELSDYCPLHGYRRFISYWHDDGEVQGYVDVGYCPRYLRKTLRDEIYELKTMLSSSQVSKIEKRFRKDINEMDEDELQMQKRAITEILRKAQRKY